ncbi:MAG: DUF2812 domain-containing protein [Clostridia bacterium]|nr:DUF2812 domain-containing protein [Clostridia bacterium]
MNRRFELPLFSFYDHTGMTTHFEEMAQRGWLLDKLGGLWRYRRIEPQRLRFAVVYFPEITGFESETPRGHAAMEELCAGTGWQLAATAGKFQVYYNEEADPVDLETDPVSQVAVIHRAMRKNFLPSYGILAATAVLQLVMQFTNLTRDFGLQHSGAVYYLSGVSWMMIPTWSLLLLFYLLEMGRYLLWYRRAKKRAEEGLMTPSVSSRQAQTLALLLLLMVVLSWVTTGAFTGFVGLFFGAMAAAGLLATLASKWMKRMKVSAKVNELVTVGIATLLILAFMVTLMPAVIGDTRREASGEGEPPLRLEDLDYPTAEGQVHLDRQHSPLVTRTYCWQWLDQPSNLIELEYIVADVHAKFLWKMCERDFLRNGAQPVEAAPWQADSAWLVNHRFSSEGVVYVLCWDRRLVWLDLEEEPTPAQKAAIAEILKP